MKLVVFSIIGVICIVFGIWMLKNEAGLTELYNDQMQQKPLRLFGQKVNKDTYRTAKKTAYMAMAIGSIVLAIELIQALNWLVHNR